MWLVAVLEPALPGRRGAATGSPDPAWPWVDERDKRMMAEGLVPGRGGVLLLGVREHQHTVDVHDDAAVDTRGSRSRSPRWIRVLSSLKTSPLGASQAASRALTCSAALRLWHMATRSSAYLITTGLSGML